MSALLLVDPDPAVVRFMEEHAGAGLNGEVLTASNAVQALTLARDNPVRVAVIALELNDEKAYDIIPHMKRIRPRMNVIVTTSDYSEQAERKSRLCGLSLYLPKPLDAGILREAVTTAWTSGPGELRLPLSPLGTSPPPVPATLIGEVRPLGPPPRLVKFQEAGVVSEKRETQDLPCPKCGVPHKSEAPSCPKCGLVFSLWKGRVAPSTDHPAFSGLGHTAFALWNLVLEEPSSESHHQAFVTYCYENSCLDFAARMYQDLLRDNPRTEQGRKYRDRIVTLAMAQYIPVRPKAGRTWMRRYTSLKVFLVLILLALSWGFAMLHLLLAQALIR